MSKSVRPTPRPRATAHPATRFIRWVLACALAALALVPVSASPAAAASGLDGSQFHGVVWSQPSERNDNFCDCDPLLDGLSSNDTYDSVKPKTAAIVAQFQSIGANTIRIPINYKTATDPWWNTYRGIVDQATSQGMTVVLSYWTEHLQTYIPDEATFDTMWNIATDTYKGNPLVDFDPINEPMSYSLGDLTNAMARFLTIPDAKGIPRSRILLPAVGWPSENVAPVCLDPRLSGTYVSMHRYQFTETQPRSYDWWVNEIEANKGTCGSRTVVEEFGAQMDTHLDFNDPTSTNPEVTFLRAMTDTIRKDHLGAIYCHIIGGRNSATDSSGAYDNLNILRNDAGSSNYLPF